MDPRISIIDRRLEGIRVVAIAGGKGGVGKSITSTVTALILSNMGYKVGLLDLDFSGPSDHTILGLNHAQPEIQPKEHRGIVPQEVCGIKFFSFVFYSGENPTPLRGIDVSNVVKEIFAVTKWDGIEILVIDMPPGMGEAVLDSIKLVNGMEFLVVTSPSKVSAGTVKKFIRLLKELRIPVLGVIENMKISDSAGSEFGDFLGSISFDMDLENAIGKPDRLMSTKFSSELREILERIF